MSKFICRICLRTDLNIRDIDETLVDFHDEITEYAVYENKTLKYCAFCEYLLLKFYHFRQKCIQANKILQNHKRKSHGYPNDLHQMLPPTSLGLSTIDKLKAFNLQDGILQPLFQLVSKDNSDANPLTEDVSTVVTDCDTHEIGHLNKLVANDHGFYTKFDTQIHQNIEASELLLVQEENDLCSESENYLQTHDSLQDAHPTSAKKKTLAEMANIDFTNENSANELYSITTKHMQDIDKQNIEDIDIEPDNESSSDTEMIAELKKRLEGSLYKITKNRKTRGILRNRNEIEKVFEILCFATTEEAKEELEQRKTSEPFLSAPHKCNICYTVHRSAKLLEFHMRWHDPSAGEHVCDICQMRFKMRISVMNHKTSAHYGRFKCKLCPMITYHRTAMEAHYKKHVGVTYECKKCSRTFKHCSSYKTHMRMQHKTEHICVTCARSFVSEKGLIAHRNLIHKTKSKTDSTATAFCEDCGLTFANDQVYTIHLMNTEFHKDEASTIIACNICGMKFEYKEEVKEHKRFQHPLPCYSYKRPVNKAKVPIASVRNSAGGKEFKCTICGYLGSSKMWLRKHIAADHPDSPYMTDLARRRQYMCDTCGKCYTSVYILRDHINSHTATKPYACDTCPSRFTSRLQLRLHAEWHAPARRECTRCGKKFISASNLHNHMRSHIQDRRYKCPLCHKGFYHSSALREHVRGVHHHERRVRNPLKSKQTRADKLRLVNKDSN